MKRGRDVASEFEQAQRDFAALPTYAQYCDIASGLRAAKLAVARHEIAEADLRVTPEERAFRRGETVKARVHFTKMTRTMAALRESFEKTREYSVLRRAAAAVPGGDSILGQTLGV